MKLAAFILALVTSAPAIAQYRCTGPDGRTSFQEQPCSKDARDQEALKLKTDRTGPAISSSVKPLDLRGSKRDILVTITAAMETLVELGRDCKTRLPVYGGRPEAMVPCSNFIEHVKVWRLPVLSAYRALLDDKDWAMANMPGVEKVGKSADEVADLEKHILLRLRAVRRELEER